MTETFLKHNNEKKIDRKATFICICNIISTFIVQTLALFFQNV